MFNFWRKIKHNFIEKKVSNKRVIYRYRKCKNCGYKEVYRNKYGDWRDIDAPWKWDWDRKEFLDLMEKEEKNDL
jgi:hypothetical protein